MTRDVNKFSRLIHNALTLSVPEKNLLLTLILYLFPDSEHNAILIGAHGFVYYFYILGAYKMIPRSIFTQTISLFCKLASVDYAPRLMQICNALFCLFDYDFFNVY